ncbi:hypothetical protein AVEN_201637-1 [Araneus ventricosus]|uniref:Uncharacterized protein n=1 Tax=Araneus ventricosus TaxID=182803 RepID=A0A4Y2KFQ5_ARAVE|nr:hypothetical protein AVEN_201637-1 [Araneus ventricosus]
MVSEPKAHSMYRLLTALHKALLLSWGRQHSIGFVDRLETRYMSTSLLPIVSGETYGVWRQIHIHMNPFVTGIDNLLEPL